MNKLKKNLDITLLFLFSLLIFSYLSWRISTDISGHIAQLQAVNSTDTDYRANFLFYFIVNLFSGFSNNLNLIYPVTIVLLSVTTVAK
jgi:hypothetical protein